MNMKKFLIKVIIFLALLAILDYATGRVFDYLHGSKNVNYVTRENMNELIFYL